MNTKYIYLKFIFCMLVLFSGTNLHEFHEQDLKRVRDDDVWLSRFLKSRKQDVNNALLALVFTSVILDKFFPEFNCVFPPTNGYHLYLIKPNGGGGGEGRGGKVRGSVRRSVTGQSIFTLPLGC